MLVSTPQDRLQQRNAALRNKSRVENTLKMIEEQRYKKTIKNKRSEDREPKSLYLT
jgi:hypothetical protein